VDTATWAGTRTSATSVPPSFGNLVLLLATYTVPGDRCTNITTASAP
jgi:hypothetical protein